MLRLMSRQTTNYALAHGTSCAAQDLIQPIKNASLRERAKKDAYFSWHVGYGIKSWNKGAVEDFIM